MKQFYTLLVLAFTIITANAQIVNIPDANFKARLLLASPSNTIAYNVAGTTITIDTNNDGNIQVSEALTVYGLNLFGLNINDLSGIESFTNLKSLNCSNNQLNSLNVSTLIDMEYLNCANNQLSTLDLSNNSLLIFLNCYNNQITSLDVSQMLSLQYLECYNNQLTSLNVATLINLETLICYNNQLTTLDLNNDINILFLDCSFNQLASLTVNNGRNIDASHNSLTEANITFNTFSDDMNLDLSYNNLTSFTASNAFFNDGFNLRYNQLTNLVFNNVQFNYCDVSYNNLSNIITQGTVWVDYDFNISNNQFSDDTIMSIGLGYNSNLGLGNNIVDTIPFNSSPGNITYNSNNTMLDLRGFRAYSSCDPEYVGNVNIENCPNLETIILKNGFNHTFVTCNEGGDIYQNSAMRLQITDCPNLSFICVDEGEQPYIQESINQLGLQNQVQVNSYCSFVPGGTFYTIQGTTTLDSNSNGCDASDAIFPNLNFSIAGGTNTGTLISNASGLYSIPVQAGTHTITPVLENPSYFTISPTSASVTFPAATSPFMQDFCVTTNGVHNDVEVTIFSDTAARPGFDANYRIIYKNKGNQVSNGSLSFSFDDAKMDLVSAIPVNTSSATNSLSWSYSNLNPFETRTIDLVFNINSPMETPAVNGGDVLAYTATIVGATDEMPSDNTMTLNQTVVNSYDPNDKTCLEGNTITPSMVGNYVHYVIRFENTGTFAAENIVVSDMIDLTKFDITSLIPQNSSHSFVTRINNTTGKVEFIFENINLPFDDANNDGYVAFKIKTKSTLVLGNTFSNKANIYFDYNFPIVTNTTSTTVSLLGTQDFDFGTYFTLYPTPAKDVLNISIKGQIGVKSVAIYNMLGQLVLAYINAENSSSLDVSQLKTGTYFIKLTTDKGTSSQQFVKE